MAPALKELSLLLSKKHHVTVVAPTENCSGFSSAITIKKTVKLVQVDTASYLPTTENRTNLRVFKVEGTPVDCAYLGLHSIFKSCPPDIVISGINQGENLAEDTIYSGTVAGAMEAFIFGVPGIAVSQQLSDKHITDFSISAKIFEQIFEKIISIQKGSYDNLYLFNVNIPAFRGYADIPSEVEATRLGRRERAKPPSEIKNSQIKGVKEFLIGTHGDSPLFPDHGTDLLAIKEKKISVTPLTVDMSCQKSLSNVGGSFEEIRFSQHLMNGIDNDK